jgi:hypothetical protein
MDTVTQARRTVLDAVTAANDASSDQLGKAGKDLPEVLQAERAASRQTIAAVIAAEDAGGAHVQDVAAELMRLRREERPKRLKEAGRTFAAVGALLLVVAVVWSALNRPPGGLIRWELPAALAIVLLALLLMSSLFGGAQALIVLVIGADNRVSTSKVMVAAWTLSLAFALLYFTFKGAIDADFAVDPLYLLLLGGPFAAWVLAGAATQTKLADGSLQKVDAAETQPLRDTLSTDNGEPSLTDTQYFAFNVVALVYFYLALLTRPDAAGLPGLPEGLVFLTSAGALTYLGQKAVQANKPAITAVLPMPGGEKIVEGDRVVIQGYNFVPPGAGGDIDTLAGVRVRFTLGQGGERIAPVIPRLLTPPDPGLPAPEVRRRCTTPRSDRLIVRVPLGATGRTEAQVLTLAGRSSDTFAVNIEARP